MAQQAQYSLGEYLNALCMLENATDHLATQFSKTMTRDEAKVHFDARSLILQHRIATHNEASALYDFEPNPITAEEIHTAIAMRETR